MARSKEAVSQRPVGVDVITSEQITVSTVAVGITAALLDNPIKDLITLQVRGANIMIRTDGTDPTSSIGKQIQAGQTYTIAGRGNLTKLRMIRESGDATVFIELMRY